MTVENVLSCDFAWLCMLLVEGSTSSLSHATEPFHLESSEEKI